MAQHSEGEAALSPEITNHRALADHLFQGIRQAQSSNWITIAGADTLAGELATWLMRPLASGTLPLFVIQVPAPSAPE